MATRSSREALEGLRALQTQLAKILPNNPAAEAEVQSIVARAAVEVRDEMRSRASAAGWPQYVIDSIFADGRQKRGRISALAGANKRRTMFEWRASRHPKSPRAKVPPGGKVAMSRATALEFGTTRNEARPAIRPAVAAAKTKVVQTLSEGFIALFAKSKG